jgi:hypothetical protein
MEIAFAHVDPALGPFSIKSSYSLTVQSTITSHIEAANDYMHREFRASFSSLWNALLEVLIHNLLHFF